MHQRYHVYIMASRTRALYIGSSSALLARVGKHRARHYPTSHTAQYRIDRLVYFEELHSAAAMTQRERQLKGWTRARKIALIEANNPTWDDLAAGWFD
jgi:putative endonuclease